MVKNGETTFIEEGTKSGPSKKKIWPFIVIAIIVIAFFIVKANFTEINDVLNPSEQVIVPTDADMQMMMFNPLSNNHSTNVELWLINIGESPATNITVKVRVRSENGTVLYENQVELSSMILRFNETCTADYTVNYQPAISAKTGWHLFHTIEVSWDFGRHTYSKETN